jgi:hypothetical protein
LDDNRNEFLFPYVKTIENGHASPHYILPQSGWINYCIEKGEEDVPPAVIELFRM